MAIGQTLLSPVYFPSNRILSEKVSVKSITFHNLCLLKNKNQYQYNQPWHSQGAILERDIF
jgi:hypothetical protein